MFVNRSKTLKPMEAAKIKRGGPLYPKPLPPYPAFVEKQDVSLLLLSDLLTFLVAFNPYQ